MATATRSTSDPLAVPAWEAGESASKSERYVGRRLAEATAEVKGIALTTFFLATAVAAVSWLLLGVLAEHWLVPGGLPRWARWAWMLAAIAAAVAAFIRWVLPLIRYRVNLVYAARAIEREHPELHNDVVNAVLAQARPDDATPLVLRSLRRRAAAQLKRVGHDGVVDYALPLRLAAVLAGLVMAAVVYELVAPKSLLLSTVRLVAPWAGIAAPARTRIDPLRLSWRQPGQPGQGRPQDVSVAQGEARLVRGRQLVVSTAIRNLRQGERPLAIVTPRRGMGTAASWRVPLAAIKDGGFEAVLPDAARGLDESIDLVVAAGDAQTEPIRVNVVDAPTITLSEVTYRYPKYTGLEDRKVEWPGDLSAVEGTDVTLVAQTNQPVDRAWVDFGGDGKGDIELAPGQRDLARVRGSFTLRLNAERSGAEHATFRLMFKPEAAEAGSAREREVHDPLEYHVDVTPDLAPEASIVLPEQKVMRVPPDAAVTVRIRAVDPDFGLASVAVETRLKNGPAVPGPNLMTAMGSNERRQRFQGEAMLLPARLGAKAGAVLEYRAVATDTRPKEPNVTATAWQSLVIDETAAPQEVPPPLSGEAGGADEGSAGEGETKGDGGQGRGERSPDANDPEVSDDPGESGADGRDAPEDTDRPPLQAPPRQESNGGEKRPSGDTGEQDRQQQKSRQQDPKPARDEGAPEQGEDQGAADGGKPQDGSKGKSGDQAGQRQQDGSSDGAGGQPQGQGGAGQAGDQEGQGREGADGKTPQQPGAGGRERKPGNARQGGDAKDAAQGVGKGDRQGGEKSAKERGQGDSRERLASDGTADGEAMERILEHRRREEPDGTAGRDTGKQSGRSEPDKNPQADAKQPGGQAAAEPKSDPDRPGAQDQAKSAPDDPADNRPPCASPDGTPCGKPGCESCSSGAGGGSQGGGASAGSGESVAKDGQPGAGGGEQDGTEGGGGKTGSKAGSGGGAGQGREIAGPGEPGESGGMKAAGEQAGAAGGRQPGAGDSQSPAPKGTPSDHDGKPNAPGLDQAGTSAADGPGGAGNDAQGAGSQGAEAGGEHIADEAGDANSNPGTDPAKSEGGGGAVGGGQRQQANAGTGERQDRDAEWTAQDLSHARNAADLALEHLRRSVDAGDRTVLDELGWTPEQAREFLARWQRMREAAGGSDRRPKREFDEAVKSLGLRPAGVRRLGDPPADGKGGGAEGRRSRPPSDYREQFRAFLQGASVE